MMLWSDNIRYVGLHCLAQMSAKSRDFMSGEVFFSEYSHLPSPRILESRFEMKERALAETIDNLTPSKSDAIIDGGNLSAMKSFSTLSRSVPVLLKGTSKSCLHLQDLNNNTKKVYSTWRRRNNIPQIEPPLFVSFLHTDQQCNRFRSLFFIL